VRGQRHAPAAFYPRERPGTHCTGGWVGPRAGLDRCGKYRPHRDSIPGPFSRSQSLYRMNYRAVVSFPGLKCVRHYPVARLHPTERQISATWLPKQETSTNTHVDTLCSACRKVHRCLCVRLSSAATLEWPCLKVGTHCDVMIIYIYKLYIY
jgi:hypothetical protein